jgi:hypothetical protein
MCVANEQSLHLASIEVVAQGQGPQGTTPGGLTVYTGQQKDTVGWCVAARQLGQLLFKILKAQVDAKIGLVVAQQGPSLVDVVGR